MQTMTISEVIRERDARFEKARSEGGFVKVGTLADWKGRDGVTAYIYHECGGPSFAMLIGIRKDWWAVTGRHYGDWMTNSWACTPDTPIYAKRADIAVTTGSY